MKKLLLLVVPFVISCSRSGNTINPVRKDIIETVYASGKIISENEYTIFALGNGTIKEKLVKEGDSVTKDQVLYVISNDAPSARLGATQSNYDYAKSNLSPESGILNDLKLSLQNAEAKFRNDSLQYFRMNNLLDQNAASKSSVDNAFTTYTISLNQKKSAEEKYYSKLNELSVSFHNAKSQLTIAQTDLSNYFIRSETSGTVFQTFKEAGEAVHANEMVALIGETSGRVIKLAVDQQDINKIKTGQEVLLKTDVNGNLILHASISRIYRVMNEIDQTFRVDAVFKESPEQPYIHCSVEANIIIQQKKNSLIIPRDALVADDSVQVHQDGKIRTIRVHTGIRTLDEIEIIGGLDESSRVRMTPK